MEKLLNILFIEDSENDIFLIERELIKNNYKINYKQVVTAEEFNNALDEEKWDVIISDYHLPKFNGIEALWIYKEKRIDIPFIIVSGAIGEETSVKLMKEGAHDYISKFNLSRLVPVIERELREVEVRKEKFFSEKKLKEKINLLETVFSSINESIVILDSETYEIIEINDATEKIFLYKKDELIGEKISIFFENEENFEELQSRIKLELNNKNKFEFNIQFKNKNGNKLYLEILASKIFNFESNNENIVFVIKDITDKINLDKIIKKTPDFYLTMFENFPALIFRTDNNLNIDYFNKTFLDFLGLNSNEALAGGFEKAIDENDFLNFKEEFYSAFLKKEIFKFEYRLKKNDGKYYWMHLLSSPYYDIDGSFLGYFAVSYDINDRKLMEEEIIKAKEIAESANEIKKNFLSNITHELRTPLNGILGMNILLEKTNLTSEQKEYLKLLRYSANNLLELINMILDFSKIDAKKLVLHNKSFKLKDLLDSINNMFEYVIKNKNLLFTTFLDSNLNYPIIGDEENLKSILVHLISNSVKFTEEGEINLIIKEKSRKNDILTVEFIVSDTGIGIPKNKINSIFESFTQLDLSYTKRYSGIGLGLTIVKELINAMNGELFVESEEGKGSKFTIILNFIADEIKISNEKNEMNVVKNILVVEDEAINRLYISSILKKNGYNVLSACNGIKALELLEKNKFDLIFMDIGMPEMDGIEATKEIRKREIKTPIVALTAHAFYEDKINCFEAGINEYLAKPIEENELNKILEKFFYLEGIEK